jgi:hypothetical protein
LLKYQSGAGWFRLPILKSFEKDGQAAASTASACSAEID